MPDTTIERIHAREVFDSRGRPTVEVEVTCAGSRPGRAIVPSGASTGRFEALELRDSDAARLSGLGVRTAVENVRTEIATALIGQNADDQAAIDAALIELDGTENKSRLGANAILGVSLAAAYAAAEAKGISPVEQFREVWSRLDPGPAGDSSSRTEMLGGEPSLPLPMVNMISGGLHAGGNLDFQDYLILPVGATSYPQAFEWIVEVYNRVSQSLKEAGLEGTLVGDEGGYGPKLASNEEALSFVVRAIEAAGLRPGDDVCIGLDVASTHFYSDGCYRLAATGDEKMSSTQVVDLLVDWVDRYPILSIEDGLAEDDWEGWRVLTDRLGDRVQLIGDDLFVTNSARLKQGIETGAGNSVLIKLNQIGSLSETLTTLRLAIDNGYWPVVSARSGETEDTTIADLVVATGAGQLKVGSVARSERLAKYNQLLRLAEEDFPYAGGEIFESLAR
ncbi:MAG: phosphopyruvate hydratase [Planctomycetes bacterium]|nr:phosphopyruvate hydratase [Planctomycetota bacterium]